MNGQKKQLRENTRQGIIAANHKRKGISRPHNQVTLFPIFSDKLIFCLAHLLFDASIHGSRICYYNRSPYLVGKMRIYMEELYGFAGAIYRQPSGVICLPYNSIELASLVKSQQHKMLREIMTWGIEWKRIFLQSFFDDEGCVYLSKDRRARYVSGTQKDTYVLLLVQILLAELGIQSRITTDTSGISTLYIRGGKEGLRKFQREINFSP